MIRLSIAIPSRNRCALLAESLAALQSQLNDEVEICVSANACTDGTDELLAASAEVMPGLRWIRQPQLVSIDQNMEAVARMARGTYVWQLGDDDLPLPGSVAAICAALTEEPDMLLLSGPVWDHRGVRLGHHRAPARLADRPAPLFRVLWDQMKYGTFVVPGAFLQAMPGRYAGTDHAYAGVVWDALVELGAHRSLRIARIDQPTAVFREVPKTYAATKTWIIFRNIPRWIDLLPAALEEGKANARRRHFRSSTRLISVWRHLRHGQLRWSTRAELLADLPWPWRLRLALAVMVLGLPLAIACLVSPPRPRSTPATPCA